MSNMDLRVSLVQQADKAFINMTLQVNLLLDAAHLYARHNPPISTSDKLKTRELRSAIVDLGSIPKMLAAEISRWKKGENRILSRNGVETNLLNELYATMEAMMWFFFREGIENIGFSIDLVKASYSELLRCNRLL